MWVKVWVHVKEHPLMLKVTEPYATTVAHFRAQVSTFQKAVAQSRQVENFVLTHSMFRAQWPMMKDSIFEQSFINTFLHAHEMRALVRVVVSGEQDLIAVSNRRVHLSLFSGV